MSKTGTPIRKSKNRRADRRFSNRVTTLNPISTRSLGQLSVLFRPSISHVRRYPTLIRQQLTTLAVIHPISLFQQRRRIRVMVSTRRLHLSPHQTTTRRNLTPRSITRRIHIRGRRAQLHDTNLVFPLRLTANSLKGINRTDITQIFFSRTTRMFVRRGATRTYFRLNNRPTLTTKFKTNRR